MAHLCASADDSVCGLTASAGLSYGEWIYFKESNSGTSRYWKCPADFGITNAFNALASVEHFPGPPTVSIITPAKANNNPFKAQFEFSEEITDFILTDIDVTHATVSNLLKTTSSHPFTTLETYSADITPAGTGDISISLAANTFKDLAGNSNTAAASRIVPYDLTQASVIIHGLPAVVNTTARLKANIRFDKVISGFRLSEVSLDNAVASNLLPVGFEQNTYSVDIKPTGAGAVRVWISGGVVVDDAGNGNKASATLRIRYEPLTNVAPVITSPAQMRFLSGKLYIDTATASDANGDELTFSLIGGRDASLFRVTPDGQIFFLNKPDNRVPKLTYTDRAYELQIQVSDTANLTDSQILAIRLKVDMAPYLMMILLP